MTEFTRPSCSSGAVVCTIVLWSRLTIITPGHAQGDLADERHAHVRRAHVKQASQAYGHKCHEQRFKADEARRHAERDHGAQHRAHAAGRRGNQPIHSTPTCKTPR